MTITILTHDERWKGLRPTVQRAAEAVFLFLNSPLEGESKSAKRDSVGGNLQRSSPHGIARAIPAPPQGGSYKCVALTLVLSNDAEVRTLNRDFRQKDKPTNVLSFPDGSVEEGVTQLGDIILAYETLAREALEQNKRLKHHLTHLTIHGVLHLLGYDHIEEKEANRMESLEIKILAQMGIANPYEHA